MYPLVYGRSRVLRNEDVDVHSAVEKWAGKGEIIRIAMWESDKRVDPFRSLRGYVPTQYWSGKYQWLPANVELQPNGTVKFTSYINNLHPEKFPIIYHNIERLIEAALPAWDQCLAVESWHDNRDGAGRTESRSLDIEPFQWEKVKERIKSTGNPICPVIGSRHIEYMPTPGKRLLDKFHESGLQIIVRMASIELTPDKPESPEGNWRVSLSLRFITLSNKYGLI